MGRIQPKSKRSSKFLSIKVRPEPGPIYNTEITGMTVILPFSGARFRINFFGRPFSSACHDFITNEQQ